MLFYFICCSKHFDHIINIKNHFYVFSIFCILSSKCFFHADKLEDICITTVTTKIDQCFCFSLLLNTTKYCNYELSSIGV